MLEEPQLYNRDRMETGTRDYGAAPKPDPGSPVLNEYGYLNAEINLLEETLSSLQHKLEPVIGVERPVMENGAIKEERQPLSPLGESIRSDTDRIRRLNMKLCALIQRIEL